MEDLLDHISQEIYNNSYVVVDDFVDEGFRKALLKEQIDLLNQGQFTKAAIGKGDQRQVRTEIRSDEVLWMDSTALSPLQAIFWEKVAEVQQVLNRRCFLGLKSFEGHFALPDRIFLQAAPGSVSCSSASYCHSHFVPKRILD
uniref:2OG-Fe(II) oxygenase n=1 Tax=Algoriphagus sp. TaxID=1872435 RepID=UPI004047D45D